MLKNLLENIRRPGKAPLQAYGKLPFYGDYIAVITTPQAMALKAWLLSTFGDEGLPIPPGSWHFLFQDTPRAPFTAGLISAGSDGRRRFPFALFATIGGTGRMPAARRWPTLLHAFECLRRVHSDIAAIADIRSFYALLPSRAVPPPPPARVRALHREEAPPDLTPFSPGESGQWPLFFVASPASRSVALLSCGPPEFGAIIDRWRLLQGKATGPGDPDPMEA